MNAEKRRVFIASAVIFLCAAACLSAENVGAENVLLLPQEVFVGDEAELRYMLPEKISEYGISEETLLKIPVPVSGWEYAETICTVKSVSVRFSDGACSVSVVFVPWRAGMIDFPPLPADVFASLLPDIFGGTEFAIDIPPIHICSALEKTGADSLQPPHAPLVVPGTTYIIYACVTLFAVVLFLLFIVFTRFRRIKNAVSGFFRARICSRAYRKAVRQLRRLEKKQALYNDAACAASLSRIIRRYFEERFSFPFCAASAQEIQPLFVRLFSEINGTLSEEVAAVQAFCVRLDFIRFSGGLPDSDFPAEERRNMMAQIKACLRFFEMPEREDSHDADACAS
ncbi:MAG: hypothetical protein NC041_09880 [Bacteroides sp.]|nr:hypothetical protein [Prevotella sp.]MCM1408526.1 hypothetical protein [Treponema brennaborense]MCM1470760.1 hypothetical protein [Bacteroides sp.]